MIDNTMNNEDLHHNSVEYEIAESNYNLAIAMGMLADAAFWQKRMEELEFEYHEHDV